MGSFPFAVPTEFSLVFGYSVSLIPAVISVIRTVIVAAVVGSGIINASVVVIIFVSGVVVVMAVSIIVWRVISRCITNGDGETLGLRFGWRHGRQPQYRNHKNKKIFHLACLVFLVIWTAESPFLFGIGRV